MKPTSGVLFENMSRCYRLCMEYIIHTTHSLPKKKQIGEKANLFLAWHFVFFLHMVIMKYKLSLVRQLYIFKHNEWSSSELL